MPRSEKCWRSALFVSDIDIDSTVVYCNNDIAYTAVRISRTNIEST